ncbi:GlsB/YeaQ/YmgE family stress response membrane protein [Ligilactobacillus apodemi]|uniref:GlsB/YeaQ/YmgE family stress response membrane protein n=1 Tax=Ligilactobacillus apodemi TaxID=307126 RepID=UPI00214CD3EF|nr:GlsB/YeaQ/YmgE family stress response membrane protein [Ligilactobacillus apodemi]MCR1901530.1 GlsB/YeaQ/YmgE family stress response membrane protein [Ligilactobacillus apodemi]
MLHWIWVLIVGAIIGAIAGALTKNGGSMGWISNILAGLIGSSIGEALLGAWGPQLAGMAIIPSLIGAVILVLLVFFILNRVHAHS